MNRYELVQLPDRQPAMSDEELVGIYRRAWDLYYSPEHVETVVRRAKAWGRETRDMTMKLLTFYALMALERVHPLEGGLVRRKYRRDRRSGLPIETRLRFYPRYAWETVSKFARFAAMWWQYRRILRRVDADNAPYTDVAMAPVRDAELDELEMFSAPQGAKVAVEKLRRRTASRAAGAVVSR